MEIKINNGRSLVTGGNKAVTFTDAERLGAFELARQATDL